MNLPNKLTLLRVILIPVFLVCIYVDAIPAHFLLALIVFVVMICFPFFSRSPVPEGW